MNAVNLAPAGSNRPQRSRPTVDLSGASLGLIGGLLVVLVATFLFMSAHDRVTSRRAELASLQAGTTQWTAAASGFNGQVQQYNERSKSLADVRQLIAERYHWSLLLSQIAGLIPRNVQLSSLQASTPTAAAADSSPTGTAVADGVTVAGCATSHSAVAAAMISLRRVTGIANVVLASSAEGAGSGSGSVTTDSGGGGDDGCALPVQFQLTLVFNASAASAAAPAATPASTDSSSGVAQ